MARGSVSGGYFPEAANAVTSIPKQEIREQHDIVASLSDGFVQHLRSDTYRQPEFWGDQRRGAHQNNG